MKTSYLIILIIGVTGVAKPNFGQKTATTSSEITIAAASDLRFAMDSLVGIFEKSHPDCRVTVIYGSSGRFFQQIVNGAPFDLFFSADKEYPMQLQVKKLTAAPMQLYAIGRLVLWSKKLDPSAKGMNTLLEASIGKIAIANPEHAPYGKRARESLIHYKLYDKVKAKIVLGENISQTAQYVTTGAADVGILALSLAINPALQRSGKYYLIPENSHTPLEQAYVVLGQARNRPTAQTFATFIASPAARQVFRQFGFTLPKL